MIWINFFLRFTFWMDFHRIQVFSDLSCLFGFHLNNTPKSDVLFFSTDTVKCSTVMIIAVQTSEHKFWVNSVQFAVKLGTQIWNCSHHIGVHQFAYSQSSSSSSPSSLDHHWPSSNRWVLTSPGKKTYPSNHNSNPPTSLAQNTFEFCLHVGEISYPWFYTRLKQFVH